MKFEFKKIKNGNYKIIDYLGNSESVIIPKKYLGKKVTHIGCGAFYNKNIENLVIQHLVKHIGNGAFGNNNLTKVTIPHSVTHIGNSAFDDCKLLEKVVIENNFKTYDCAQFHNCYNLKEIVFKDKKYGFEIIDGISMLVINTKQKLGYTIKKCLYLHNQKKCYVVSAEGYNAHGEAIREAIYNLKEKLRKDEDKIKLIKETALRIVKENKLQMKDYMILANACETGSKEFCDLKNIKYDEYVDLDKAVEITKDRHGYNDFIENLTNNGYILKGGNNAK